ncbi:MAG: hypothetical protein IKP47_08410 [Ruminococcus sp.]|nr:hypothetical protein [Ruminococcus sp.]
MDEKTAAQRRCEEYEKRFAGMSADEIFGDPEPKRPAPQLESMMPGEALKLSWKGAAVSAGLMISAVIFGIVRGG